MAGLVPATHVVLCPAKGVGARHKAGHDNRRDCASTRTKHALRYAPRCLTSVARLMQTHLLVIFVLATIAVAAIAANRSKLPPAIVMVLVGLVLALTPGLPRSSWRRNWCCCWSCRR